MCSDRVDMDRCVRLRGAIRNYFTENQRMSNTEVTPLTFRAEHNQPQGPVKSKVSHVSSCRLNITAVLWFEVRRSGSVLR